MIKDDPKNRVNSPLNPANWLKLYGNYLFSYAMLRLKHRETAEDLVQDTFVSAMRSRENFRGDSSEKTWLVAILKNKITDHYRQHDVLKNSGDYLEQTDEEFTKNFFETSTGHWLKAAVPQLWADATDAEIENAEFNLILQNCIQKIPSKLAAVFIARFFDEEESEEICKVHNISSSNYWVIIHRAKVLLRSCLEKNWFLAKPEK